MPTSSPSRWKMTRVQLAVEAQGKAVHAERIFVVDCSATSDYGLSVSLSFCLSFCLSVSLSVFLSVFLSVCLSLCLSLCLSFCLSLCLSQSPLAFVTIPIRLLH